MNLELNNLKALIDFNNPDEDLVIRAIFLNAQSGDHRGFTDAFSKEEIQTMAASPGINNWLQHHREWLLHTASME